MILVFKVVCGRFGNALLTH
ncbi:hypothetical protein FCV48_04120 [Vibrio alginolyticus]|nr:hypothetical protein FCV48_04120 [Vibrio alginolyticus]